MCGLQPHFKDLWLPEDYVHLLHAHFLSCPVGAATHHYSI